MFCVVLARILAPVAPSGRRLRQMEAPAWSFDLPKSRLGASRWRQDLIETRFLAFFEAFLLTFLCFVLGQGGSDRAETYLKEHLLLAFAKCSRVIRQRGNRGFDQFASERDLGCLFCFFGKF